jgi:hypothetical protein
VLANALHELLNRPLPSKRFQRKRLYRPSKEELCEAFDILNEHLFDNVLKRPSILVRSMPYWGLCLGYDDDEPPYRVKIRLSTDLFCHRWMVLILAHEMAHQHQWEIHGPKRKSMKREPLLSHGPSFFEFKAKFLEYGIPLKIMYDAKKWLKHQDLMKV